MKGTQEQKPSEWDNIEIGFAPRVIIEDQKYLLAVEEDGRKHYIKVDSFPDEEKINQITNERYSRTKA